VTTPDPNTPRVAIVGGGASGVLLAIQLLRQARQPIEVVLVEPRRPGRGVAYGTPHHEHLLNVPVSRMSALPDDPTHFQRWVSASGVAHPGDGFIPRSVFGLYLEGVLAEASGKAAPGVRFRWLAAEAAQIRTRAGSAVVRLCGGVHASIQVARVALALGNYPADGPVPEIVDASFYIRDPWAEQALERIAPDHAVLLLGTGLTMVDVALTLAARGHAARIHALSRRGLIPQPHGGPGSASPGRGGPSTAGASLASALRAVRLEARAAARNGGDWRSVIDALRPGTAALWSALPLEEQRRFLRHLRPYWDVHRHRMPPETARTLSRLRRAGSLVVDAGRVIDCATAGDDVVVRILPRGKREARLLRVRHIVNARGPETDVTKVRSPLLRQLLADGLVRPDRLALGLEATSGGALVDRRGNASSVLATLGPPLRGALWETTAIPEIRDQARVLASTWLRSLEERLGAPRRAPERDDDSHAISGGPR
jgi:uncharacterized NAD(P)/FAD-binding protein YdhS